jgi:hypothetical protein
VVSFVGPFVLDETKFDVAGRLSFDARKSGAGGFHRFVDDADETEAARIPMNTRMLAF